MHKIYYNLKEFFICDFCGYGSLSNYGDGFRYGDGSDYGDGLGYGYRDGNGCGYGDGKTADKDLVFEEK